jgi:hypothetical protein
MKEAVGEPFLLQSLIVPVAIVDPPTISATTVSMVLGTPASAGELTAPALNTRLADTLALAGGNWDVFILVAILVGSTGTVRIRRRNSGDSGDIWAQRVGISDGTGGNAEGVALLQLGPLRMTFLANERLVVEVTSGGGAGTVWHSNIWFNGPY